MVKLGRHRRGGIFVSRGELSCTRSLRRFDRECSRLNLDDLRPSPARVRAYRRRPCARTPAGRPPGSQAQVARRTCPHGRERTRSAASGARHSRTGSLRTSARRIGEIAFTVHTLSTAHSVAHNRALVAANHTQRAAEYIHGLHPSSADSLGTQVEAS